MCNYGVCEMHVAMATDCYISTFYYTRIRQSWSAMWCVRSRRVTYNHNSEGSVKWWRWWESGPVNPPARVRFCMDFLLSETMEEKNEVWLSVRECYTHAFWLRSHTSHIVIVIHQAQHTKPSQYSRSLSRKTIKPKNRIVLSVCECVFVINVVI